MNNNNLTYEVWTTSPDGRVSIKYFDSESDAHLGAEIAYQVHSSNGDDLEIKVVERLIHSNGQSSCIILS